MISSFRGEHAYLSNFWIEPFSLRGVVVPTAEHAYQAQKCAHGDTAVRALILSACDRDGNPSPGHAKRLGQRVKLREGWEEIKVEVMRQILAAKFSAGSMLAEGLLGTGDEQLVEGNTWNDKFWGCVREPQGGTWIGANHLGILLMERREALRDLR